MEEKEKGEEERRKEGKEGICKTRAKKKKKKFATFVVELNNRR